MVGSKNGQITMDHKLLRPKFDAIFSTPHRPRTGKGVLRKRGDGGEHEVLMEGDMSRVVRVPAEPGSLVFFFGSHALHRAAAPSGSGAADDGAGSSSSDTGDADRIGLVFTFGETAEVANSDETKNNNGWDPTDDDVVGAPRSAAAGGSGGGSSSSKL